ncbi:MAG: DUF3048 C-terminal domain-containing protein, partial [Candidatus Wallbacteria bacterium]|nr:DUF3048 C-terminal domain-containing protein [Candidatus Wallbacteria bacterium]
RYSPVLKKYVRLVNDAAILECDNVVFQMIKSDREQENFTPSTVGFGSLLAFRGGDTVKGVWLKENSETPVKFYDANGDLLELNQGSTWIEVLPEEMGVDYHTY